MTAAPASSPRTAPPSSRARTRLACGTVSGDYLDFGVACLAGGAKVRRVFEDPTGEPVLQCRAPAMRGSAACCRTPPNGSTCEGGFDPCSYTDDGGVLFADGSTTPTCFFNFLLINCVYDQPTSIDCSTFGGGTLLRRKVRRR